jgi:hypothetical protein
MADPSPGREFWPRDVWPPPINIIPHPSWLRRQWCRVTGGHAWAAYYWSEFEKAAGWPVHEHCEKCWKFRNRLPASTGLDC